MVRCGYRLALGAHPVLNAASLSAFTRIMFQSYLPKEFWSPRSQEEVEAWLVENIPELMLRKEILIDWCAYFNIPFTRAKAIAIGVEKYP